MHKINRYILSQKEHDLYYVILFKTKIESKSMLILIGMNV